MSPLDVLEQEVLHSGLVVGMSGNAVRLREPNSPLKEVVVQVENLERTLALRIDKAKINGLFQKGRGQLKRCDYVIFTEVEGQKYIIFIEMKHKDSNDEEIVQQFLGAECLVEYVDSILTRFYDYKKNSLLNQYEERFVLFYKISIHKKTTRPKKKRGKNRKPKQYLRKAVLNKSRIQVREIV
jgi:hypothetical protein